MPVFEYRGLNQSGRNVKGTVDAENSRAAKAKLKKDGVYVVDLKDRTRQNRKAKGKRKESKRKVSIQDLSLMTRQLATLLKASIPLVDALGAVSEQVENEYLASVVAEIKNSVNEGGTFHRALARYPNLFSKLYVSLCEAGEMSGTLDLILIRLAEFTEAQNELTSKVKSAMLYPIIMFVFIIFLLAGLFIYVIPKIVEIFDAFPEITLPWYSVVIIDLSGFMVNYWLFILGFLFLMSLLFKSWKNTPNGHRSWDSMKLKFPVVGKINRIVAVSRFTRTLATLLNGGVPMLTAMGIVRNVVDNDILAEAIDLARDNISEGESIAGPLRKSGQFPPLVIHMINIGEKTGELENMLSQVSDAYDFQVKTQVDGLTSLLTPVMLVVMGLVVGIIVFAIMIPIIELSQIGG